VGSTVLQVADDATVEDLAVQMGALHDVFASRVESPFD